jgi:uncharacterized protein YbaR (Trm112 family)
LITTIQFFDSNAPNSKTISKMHHCPICIDDIPSEELHVTSCGHVLHKRCWAELVDYNTTHHLDIPCPMCKHMLVHVQPQQQPRPFEVVLIMPEDALYYRRTDDTEEQHYERTGCTRSWMLLCMLFALLGSYALMLITLYLVYKTRNGPIYAP